MKKWIVVSLLVASPVTAFAQAQAPTCEEQLALSNQLLQDIAQERGRLQMESASLKVQVTAFQREKAAASKVEKPAKEKK